MYADDGLYFREPEERDEFSRWIDRLYWKGIRVEPEKTRMANNKFSFLGVKFDLERRTLEYEGSKISMDENKEILTAWLKSVAQFYGKDPKGWYWEIKPTSKINSFKPELGVWMRIKILFWGLMFGKSYKGYRWFLSYGIFDVIASSSLCCNNILENQIKYASLKAFGPLKLEEKGAFKAGAVKKRGYSVIITHIFPPNYAPWSVSRAVV